MPARTPPETEVQVIELYRDLEYTVYEVADRTGVCRDTVSAILKRNRVKVRDRSEAQAGRLKTLTHEDLKKTEFLYDNLALSSSEAGAALGISESSVRMRLKRSGVSRRSKSEAVTLLRAKQRGETRADVGRRRYAEREIVVSGVAGVQARGDHWEVRIDSDGERRHLGTRETLLEAVRLRAEGERQHLGEVSERTRQVLEELG